MSDTLERLLPRRWSITKKHHPWRDRWVLKREIVSPEKKKSLQKISVKLFFGAAESAMLKGLKMSTLRRKAKELRWVKFSCQILLCWLITGNSFRSAAKTKELFSTAEKVWSPLKDEFCQSSAPLFRKASQQRCKHRRSLIRRDRWFEIWSSLCSFMGYHLCLFIFVWLHQMGLIKAGPSALTEEQQENTTCFWRKAHLEDGWNRA